MHACKRIADELWLKLQIRLSPRTVRKYIERPWRPRGSKDQRWSSEACASAFHLLIEDCALDRAGEYHSLHIYRVAKEALLSAPELHVTRVYTREQLDNGIPGDFIARAAMNGYYPKRSGDISIVLEPNYMPGSHGTSHFSPYAYDRHVPVLFFGPGIKPGRYNNTIEVNDIAPTLATMLDIQTPSGSSGRVLTEMLLH
jgi:hypothetical protein